MTKTQELVEGGRDARGGLVVEACLDTTEAVPNSNKEVYTVTNNTCTDKQHNN